MERQTAARIRPPCMHDHRIPANRVIQDFGSLTDDEVRTRMCLFSRSWTVVMSICGERMSVYREGMSVCDKPTLFEGEGNLDRNRSCLRRNGAGSLSCILDLKPVFRSCECIKPALDHSKRDSVCRISNNLQCAAG